jgi:hypothetical protein
VSGLCGLLFFCALVWRSGSLGGGCNNHEINGDGTAIKCAVTFKGLMGHATVRLSLESGIKCDCYQATGLRY